MVIAQFSSPMLTGMIFATFAGLSTTIGAFGTYFIKENSRMIGLAMGFSAGVMIGISIFELLPQAIEQTGLMNAGLAMILGMIFLSILDFFIPHDYLYEQSGSDGLDIPQNVGKRKLGRTGILVAFGVAIHNLPEGFVTLTGSLHSLELGFLLAIAIAFHNVPEGLSVALPIYFSTDSRKEAFKYSFLSGLAEPIGALIASLIFLTIGITSPEIIHTALAFVAGIMLFISLDELLPSARENSFRNGNDTHGVTFGIISGISLIFLTLLILA
ncbi:MAG: ZIP family metal transporter [Candidatus Hodarchaeales archaeon]